MIDETENNEEQKFSYDIVRNDPNVQDAVLTYQQQRYGDFTKVKEDGAKLVDDFMEEMRWSTTNTVSAGKLAYWLFNDADQNGKDNFSFLFSTFDQMPNFYEDGGSGFLDGVIDYTLASVFDPFTLASAWSGGTAKVAQTTATRATIRQMLKSSSKDQVRKNA